MNITTPDTLEAVPAYYQESLERVMTGYAAAVAEIVRPEPGQPPADYLYAGIQKHAYQQLVNAAEETAAAVQSVLEDTHAAVAGLATGDQGDLYCKLDDTDYEANVRLLQTTRDPAALALRCVVDHQVLEGTESVRSLYKRVPIVDTYASRTGRWPLRSALDVEVLAEAQLDVAGSGRLLLFELATSTIKDAALRAYDGHLFEYACAVGRMDVGTGMAALLEHASSPEAEMKLRDLYNTVVIEAARSARTVPQAVQIVEQYASTPEASATMRRQLDLLFEFWSYGAESPDKALEIVEAGMYDDARRAATIDALKAKWRAQSLAAIELAGKQIRSLQRDFILNEQNRWTTRRRRQRAIRQELATIVQQQQQAERNFSRVAN